MTSAAGSTTCGDCPTRPLVLPFVATITASMGGGNIQSLKLDSGGLDIHCDPRGEDGSCVWICRSNLEPLPTGDHTLVFAAPGYESATVTLNVPPPPTDCGCCGCEQTRHEETVTLTPNGDDTGQYCAALDTDPTNCGAYGNVCAQTEGCKNGECVTCRPQGDPCGGGAPCCTGQVCCYAAFPNDTHGYCTPNFACVY